MRRICYELPVLGMDVVEVSPPYDHADITALLGNRVVLEALTAMAAGARTPATEPPGIRAGRCWDRSPGPIGQGP